MGRSFDNEWERELDQRLKALPDKTAPDNLIRNVLREIERRRLRAWYQRSYDTWSVPLKVGMGALALVLGAFFTMGYYIGMDVWTESSTRNEWIQWFHGMSRLLEAIDAWMTLTMRTVLGQYALGLLVFATLIYGLVLGAGAYIWRAFKKKAEDRYAL